MGRIKLRLNPKDLNLWVKEGHPFTAIDLREKEQRDKMPIIGIDYIIANERTLPISDKDLVLICQYGLVTEGLIIEKGLRDAYSLSGGVESWNTFILDKIDMSNWSRQIILEEIGVEGQRKLMNSRVGIVGMGGLGCPAAQALIGAGVMNLVLIDGDIIEQSNIHRQVLYGVDDVGLLKVDVAKQKLKRIYGAASIEIIDSYLDSDNGVSFFSNLDIVIDATDNNASRELIDYFSKKYNVPMIYGGLYRYEGQVSVLNVNGSCGYTDLFPDRGNSKNCNEAGILGMLPGIIGNIQALEAVKILVGIRSNLIGKLMIYDGMRHETKTIEL